MSEDAKSRLKELEKELEELNRDRGRVGSDINPTMSSKMRQQAVEKVDRLIEAKKAEIGRVQQTINGC